MYSNTNSNPLLGRNKPNDDDDDDDDKDEINSKIPKPLYPKRDIPLLPPETLENFDMIARIVESKQRFRYSIFYLKSVEQSKPESVERYSSRFTSTNQHDPKALLEKSLNLEYFPGELYQIRKKARKRVAKVTKTLEQMQKEEEEGGEKKEGEGDEENQDEDLEDNEDLTDEEYEQNGKQSDDEDMSDGDDGDGEAVF